MYYIGSIVNEAIETQYSGTYFITLGIHIYADQPRAHKVPYAGKCS